MPPVFALNFEEWREQVVQWIEQGVGHEEMRQNILEATGKVISERTWRRYLKAMNLQTYQRVEVTPELRDRIRFIFATLRLTDADTVDVLRLDGFGVSVRRVRSIRKEMGLKKCVPRELHALTDDLTREVLREELDSNRIAGYGRGNLYTYMRSKYNLVGRYLSQASCRPRLPTTLC